MLQGFFEAIDRYDGQGWVAKGWAFDPERPAESVELQLWWEHGYLSSFRADQPRADLATAGIGSGRNAFEVFLPSQLLDCGLHLLHIVDARHRRVLGRSPRRFTVPRFRGRLETVLGLMLEGWAKDELDPDHAPSIDVLVDDRPVMRAIGNRFRADLVWLLGTSGRNGFRIVLPLDLCDDQPHQVVLRFTNTDVTLDGCPAEVRLSPAVVPSSLEQAYRDLRAQQERLDAERARLERFPLRPIMDPATYRRWLARHERRWQTLRPRPAPAAAPPVFTVIAEALDGPAALAALVASLDASTPQWELIACIPGQDDARIVPLPAGEAGILGTALERARGAFVVLLGAGSVPHPALLAELLAATEDDGTDAVYVDDDRLTPEGGRSDPRFKPDWDPDRCLESGYVGDAVCLRRSALVEAWRRLAPAGINGWNGWEGVVEAALLALPVERVRHLPFVLWHRAPAGRPAEPATTRAARLRLVLAAVGHPGRVELLEGRLRIRHPLPEPAPAVTLIIPTRDRVDLLRSCVDSILSRTLYAPLSILIVDNGSCESETLAYFSTLEAHPAVRVIRRPGPFNFAALNNQAVALAATPLIGLVNNDVEAIAPDWLGEMAAQALRPEVGAVGAKLLFPDGRIQHGGVVVGFHGVADNAQQSFDGAEPGYLDSAVTTQNVSAVTAACLLCRRDTYLSIGGLDETAFAVSFNDVDFCLKLRARGLRIIWTPHATLYHHESASRGAERSPDAVRREQAEADRLRSKWSTDRFVDPFYSPNLARTGHSHSDFAWPREEG